MTLAWVVLVFVLLLSLWSAWATYQNTKAITAVMVHIEKYEQMVIDVLMEKGGKNEVTEVDMVQTHKERL